MPCGLFLLSQISQPHPCLYLEHSYGFPLTLGLLKTAAAAAKSLRSCPTLCDPIDGSPPGSPVPGILQARTLEWGAISFSNAWKWKVKVKSLSHVQLLATPMDFSPPGSSVHGIFQAKDYFLIKPLFKDLCFGEFPWSPCLEQHSHLHASPYRCHHLTQFYTFLYAFALLCEDWMSCLLPHFQYLKCCLRLGLSWYLWMEGMKSKLYSLT